jgi:diadenosine tetraphosphate (Ap4A) HIT family hydrolase
MDCITCDVNAGRLAVAGGVIYDSPDWRAEHGVDRLVRGYVVMKPKRHVHEFADLLPSEAIAFGPALQTVLHAMRSALAPERIYCCSFGEVVHHLHFHLIPRYPDMPALGPNVIADMFAERWACTIPEADDAAARIRAALVI